MPLLSWQQGRDLGVVLKNFPEQTGDQQTLVNRVKELGTAMIDGAAQDKLQEDLYCEEDLVSYGARVTVLAALCRCGLSPLHDSHQGAEATKCQARQVVYWPGINVDTVNTVRAHKPCQVMQLSRQQKPSHRDNPTRLLESVLVYFFSTVRKYFLVIKDQLSG